jgi:hypothetical protein
MFLLNNKMVWIEQFFYGFCLKHVHYGGNDSQRKKLILFLKILFMCLMIFLVDFVCVLDNFFGFFFFFFSLLCCAGLPPLHSYQFSCFISFFDLFMLGC